MTVKVTAVFSFLLITIKANHDFIANTTFKSTIKLEPFTARKLDCLNIPSDAKYVLFESHLYGQNITLSYDYPYYYKKLSSQRSITGSDIGLVQILEPQATETFIWLLNPNDNIVEILVIISYHSTKEPLPGGCNLEFNVEISPFLKLYNDGIETRLEYQRASTGAPRGVSPLSCDTTNRQIVYEVYVYFMAENDYSKKETYRALQLMDNAKSVQQYGTLVKTYSFNPQTRVSMLSYPGRAVVYNVVAKFKGQEANYVPITSFGCDVNSKVDGCGRLSSIIGKILLIVLGILGLIVCFRGHKYFSFQTMFFGFIATAIPTFVLIAKYTDLSPSERDALITFVGLLGASLWLSFWRLFASPVLSTLLSGFVFGFLMTATILFSSLGNDLILRNDVNYWLVIACGILLFPILILPFGNLLSIISCSVVGSFTAIVAIDRFIGGSLSYILLNVLKRAAFEKTNLASNQVPFQTKDIALSVSWCIVALFGIIVQFYESRNTLYERFDQSSIVNPRMMRTHANVLYSRNNNFNPQNSNASAFLPPYLRYPSENEPLLRSKPKTRSGRHVSRYEAI